MNSKIIPRGIAGDIGNKGFTGPLGDIGPIGFTGPSPKLSENLDVSVFQPSAGDILVKDNVYWRNSNYTLSLGSNQHSIIVNDKSICLGTNDLNQNTIRIGQEIKIDDSTVSLGPIYVKDNTVSICNTDYSGLNNSIIIGETARGTDNLINIQGRNNLIALNDEHKNIIFNVDGTAPSNPTNSGFYMPVASKTPDSGPMLISSNYKQLLYNPITTEIIALT